MLTAILATAIAVATAGDFADKMAYHGQAMQKVKTAIREAGQAQKDFKEVLDRCAPKLVKTQKLLLECAADFHAVQYRMTITSGSIAETKSFVEKLDPELAASKEVLLKLLNKTEELVTVTTDRPQKLSEAYLNSNSSYVKKQIEKAVQSAKTKKRIQLYCDGLQSNIRDLGDQTRFSLDQRLSFAFFFRQSNRIASIIAMGKAVAGPCNKQFNVSELEQLRTRLNEKITNAEFIKFKSEFCPKTNGVLASMSGVSCQDLPLNAYSVHWIAKLGASK
jgi:hypothetical protein